MSYDILAFDPAAVSDADFPAWWGVQSEWSEDHSYDDPEVTTANLRSFYNELIQTFPPMNGPGCADGRSLASRRRPLEPHVGLFDRHLAGLRGVLLEPGTGGASRLRGAGCQARSRFRHGQR